jgi:hypothetical protein
VGGIGGDLYLRLYAILGLAPLESVSLAGNSGEGPPQTPNPLLTESEFESNLKRKLETLEEGLEGFLK